MARVRLIITFECGDDRAEDLRDALDNYQINDLFEDECMSRIRDWVGDHEENEDREELDFDMLDYQVEPL